MNTTSDERRGAAPSPLDPAGDVCVAIVTYRTPQVLAECLQSFERHRPRRVGEVVVVDNSVEVGEPPTKRFPWIEYRDVGENLHFRRGVNLAVSLATLHYVLILNPDTYLVDGESIARMAEVLDGDDRIGFVGPKMRGDDGLLAPQGERLAGLLQLVLTKGYLNALWPGNPLAGWQARRGASREKSGPVDTVSAGALLCRREEFLAVGGFDPRATIYWEEQELARKLRRHGQRGWYEADSFVFHRWRKGGTEHDGDTDLGRHFEESMRLYYRMFYGRPGGILYDALNALQRVARAVRR